MKISFFTLKGWAVALFLSSALGVGLGWGSVASASDGGSISLAPTQAELKAGDQLQVSATVRDAAGVVVPSAPVVYSVEPTTLGSIDQTGLFTARRVGQGLIVAKMNDHRATVSVNIPFHAPATDVELWPVGRETISDEYTITSDETVQLEVVATDQFGNEWNATNEAVFSTNNPDGAFVESTFNPGALGNFEVKATIGNVSDANLVTIERGALYALSVDLKSSKVSTDDRVSLAATGYDVDRHSWNMTDEVTFETTDPKGTIQNQIYLPGGIGTWKLTASYGQISGSIEIEVKRGEIQTITLLPRDQEIRPGGIVRYRVFAADADDNTWDVTGASTLLSDAGAFFGNRLDVGKKTGTMDVAAQYQNYLDTTTVTVKEGSSIKEAKAEQPKRTVALEAFAPVEPQASQPSEPIAAEPEAPQESVTETPTLTSGVVAETETEEDEGQVLGVEDESAASEAAKETAEEEQTGVSLNAPVVSEETVTTNTNTPTQQAAAAKESSSDKGGSSTGAWITIGIILALGLIGVGVIGLTQRRA